MPGFAKDDPLRAQRLLKERELMWPPPIPFAKLCMQGRSKEPSDKNGEHLLRKFDIPVDRLSASNERFSKKYRAFSGGSPFDWCVFREDADMLFEEYGLEDNLDTLDDDGITCNINKRHNLLRQLARILKNAGFEHIKVNHK